MRELILDRFCRVNKSPRVSVPSSQNFFHQSVEVDFRLFCFSVLQTGIVILFFLENADTIHVRSIQYLRVKTFFINPLRLTFGSFAFLYCKLVSWFCFFLRTLTRSMSEVFTGSWSNHWIVGTDNFHEEVKKKVW